jgi:hypothetical protein
LTWQECILIACSMALNLALIPTLVRIAKPASGTAALTCIVLAIIAITYATLAMFAAAISTTIGAVLWGVVWVQARSQLPKEAWRP